MNDLLKTFACIERAFKDFAASFQSPHHVMGCEQCGADLDVRDHYETCPRSNADA